jgi:hypothetical protein
MWKWKIYPKRRIKPAYNSHYNGFGQLAFPKYREKSWFCIWDNLLRLFAIARVANPKIEFKKQ